jgi:hypothetical protein
MFSSGKLLASSPSDPYFNYNTLLLKETGTNGQQNNTFVDGSENNFTITRNGNSTQGTFAPFGNFWSTYLNGTSNYLSLPSSSAFAFGTDNLTIESWCYFVDGSASSNRVICSNYGPSTAWSTDSFYFGKHTSASGKVTFWLNNFSSSSPLLTDPNLPPSGTWVHYAVTRSTNTWTLWRNGVSVATGTYTGNPNATKNSIIIGEADINANYFFGYISNFRIVKGTAVYTTTFTPSTTPLTAVANTVLLTCQSNRHIDNSTNNFAVTPNASPPISKFSPFLGTAYSTSSDGGSGYFDGTGDYLTVAGSSGNAAFNFGSGDVTIECWVNHTTITGTQNYYRTQGAGANAVYLFRQTNGQIEWAVYNSTGTLLFSMVSAASALTVNTWYHVAIVRNGNTHTIYVNGVASGTPVTASYTAVVPQSNIFIGVFGAGLSELMNGYISNLRVVKDTAVYTANFTPPTAPLTAVSNTSLLLNFTNSGIYDVSKNNTLETVGSAQANTTQSKWGGSSIYFAGAGNYLVPNADSSLNAFDSGNFTIEFWVYLNATQTSIFYDGRAVGTTGAAPSIYVSNNALFYFTNNVNRITGATLSNTTWTHIAVSRSGTSTRMFINGTQTGSTYTDSVVYVNYASRPIIGGDGNNLSSAFFLNGYMEDLRVTKGIARYTANFTAPTAPFPTR